MERDGFTTSIWQASNSSFIPHGSIPREFLFDVLIVGGGITGLATALELQREGLNCILIEARELGFGTTLGTTAHINTILETTYHDIEKKFSGEASRKVARAVQDAIGLIRKNVSAYQIDCGFSMQTGYVFSEDESQTEELDRMIRSCSKVGVAAEYTGGAGFPFPYQKMMMLPEQAQFHPGKYILGLAKQFEEKGGIIIQHCRFNKLEKDEHLLALTSKGNIPARHVIYATHTPPGVNLLHTLIAPYRSYAIAFEVEMNDYPDGLVYDLQDPYHYLRVYKENGSSFLIVGGEDHKTGNFSNTETPYRNLEAWTMKYFPVRSVAYRWSSQYYEPADGLAYIGKLPGENENVFVATGFAGNGMIYSHISAILLRDLIVKKTSEYEDVFSPKRVKPVASFNKFIKENAEVVRELITGILPREKLEAAVDIAPGEGMVVSYDGRRTGVYKDDAGNLFAVNPVCPHMKCVVEWNSTEKSWDCPCHGSRFSYTGELITGPSRHDLEIYQLNMQKG